ncbi:hypothetical protein OIU84_028960 [Salix udensis]|uniref:Uncharacterized protein n=1 Tax=Salix udensis TaxID=889485 RepID=A0AAD6KE35_9ROSI|nr:hypothetical protein OIU84_028960 [Salix udensis]
MFYVRDSSFTLPWNGSKLPSFTYYESWFETRRSHVSISIHPCHGEIRLLDFEDGRKIWLNFDESRVNVRSGQKLELSQLVMESPCLVQGKVTLARSVITSIPIYSAIQIFWLSQAVCEADTDKIVQDFIWGREDWNAISRLRQFGRLGLRDARLFHISL